MKTLNSHTLVEPIGALLEGVTKSELMPRFSGLIRNVVSQKTSAFDVVSEADEASEKLITDRPSWLFQTPSSSERRRQPAIRA
ncbi:hypothetical protein ACTGJ9_013355 [Bradyrhizobium sp. RDM12]